MPGMVRAERITKTAEAFNVLVQSEVGMVRGFAFRGLGFRVSEFRSSWVRICCKKFVNGTDLHSVPDLFEPPRCQ